MAAACTGATDAPTARAGPVSSAANARRASIFQIPGMGFPPCDQAKPARDPGRLQKSGPVLPKAVE